MQPGTVVGGDFEIQGPLSSGGMGSVYLARQLSTGSDRALKVMHRELVANTKLRQRFEQEARISSRIESEHVVSVVAAGVDAASGVPFLVMELLRGETLAERIESKGPMGARLAHAMFVQLLHAIIAAHRAGIVHRDLKPENIFLTHSMRAGGGMEVKVLDFGIAKLTADANTQKTHSLGTPLWMAPEQSDAESRVTDATDVWALGLIVFYVLAGKPYWLSGREGSSIQALFREVLLEPMPKASERARELATVALPSGFDAFFARATERDPTARFATAGEAWATLGPLLEAVPGDASRRATDGESEASGFGSPIAAPLPCLSRMPDSFDRTAARPCLSMALPNNGGSASGHDQTQVAPHDPYRGISRAAPGPALVAHPREASRSRVPLYLLGGAGLVLLLAVIAVVVLLGKQTSRGGDAESGRSLSASPARSSSPRSARPTLEAILTVDRRAEPVSGPDTARVTMIWYSAFGCEECDKVATQVSDLLGLHPTDLRVVHRDCLGAPETRSRSVAARAAFLSGGTEDFYKARTYALESAPAASSASAEETFAKALGRAPTRAVLAEAERQVGAFPPCEVSGLPKFFINGERHTGSHPVGYFQQVIERQLQLINPKLDTGMLVTQAYEEVVRANLK